MEKYNQQEDIIVFGVEVTTFPNGIGEAFGGLMKVLGNQRAYYGISWCTEDGGIAYYAMAPETFQDEAKRYNYETLIIPKGEYVTETITDWRSKTDCIKDVFSRLMKDSKPDNNHPCVEWYQSDDEMLCMVKTGELNLIQNTNMSHLQTVFAETLIHAPIEKIWKLWTEPQHIKNWNNKSDEWQTPIAENDLTAGGKLFYRMEMKDGSFGFDYKGTYDAIVPYQEISYTTSDKRKVMVSFNQTEQGVKLREMFEIPGEDDPDFHISFCQSILDSFRAYVEKANKER